MDILSFQRSLNELGLEVFTSNDFVKITNQTKDVANTVLCRWENQKKIYRLTKGFYSMHKIDSKFQLQKVFSETYIGLNSALEYYQSTTQRFRNLSLISIRVLNNQNLRNFDVTFYKVKENMFFGFEKQNIGGIQIFVSNMEKTIIDCVYFSDTVYLSEINEFIKKTKSKINVHILKVYLDKIGSFALNKRVGYLLEKQGIIIEGLELNNKYEKLNKNLGKQGEKNKKWKLIINEVL